MPTCRPRVSLERTPPDFVFDFGVIFALRNDAVSFKTRLLKETRMLRAPKPRSSSLGMFKNVHPEIKSVHDLPKTVILADVVRSLENSLKIKGLVESSFKTETFYPLWFLVETERNIFLWRNGLSLSNQDDFEFWVDLPKIVEKRLKQIDRFSPENPFLSPLWGSASAQPKVSDEEKQYFKELIEVTTRMQEHLHALSQVGSILLQENSFDEKEIVLLPG